MANTKKHVGEYIHKPNTKKELEAALTDINRKNSLDKIFGNHNQLKNGKKHHK